MEASHSFSLRTYGKDKVSQQLIESMRQDADGNGKDSGMSNYSKIKDDSQNRKSVREQMMNQILN